MINTCYSVKVSGSEEKGTALYAVTFPDGTGNIFLMREIPHIVYNDVLRASQLIGKEADYVLTVDGNGLAIVRSLTKNDPKTIEKLSKLFAKMPITQLQWYATKEQVIGVVASNLLEAVNVADLDVVQKKDVVKQVTVAAKVGYNNAQAKAGGKILESLGINLPKLSICAPAPAPVTKEEGITAGLTVRVYEENDFRRASGNTDVDEIEWLNNRPTETPLIAPSGFDRATFNEDVAKIEELQNTPIVMTAALETTPVQTPSPARKPPRNKTVK
jgi:hypothetical protein